MKATCPYCRRRFTVTDPRSLLANEFCSRCISERVKQTSGYEWKKSDGFKFVPHSEGYGNFVSLYLNQ